VIIEFPGSFTRIWSWKMRAVSDDINRAAVLANGDFLTSVRYPPN
jgi:hypothetical protein